MTDTVDSKDIERIVGVKRDLAHHIGVRKADNFYILHSRLCFKVEDDLRDCAFSKALDITTIRREDWELDESSWLYIDDDGFLRPWHQKVRDPHA